MFYKDTALTTFNCGSLGKLTAGKYMFYNCKLNANSVKNISLTINKTVTGSPRIDLGIDSSVKSDAQVMKDVGLIKKKGWNVYVGSSSSSSNYTLPKYSGCKTVNDIKAVDSNYLTTDIVNGAWGEHLMDLTSGAGLFNACTTLTSFAADLSSLTNGTTMFKDCQNLINFKSNLSSVTTILFMFQFCYALTTFEADLSSLVDGGSMFIRCDSLTSFKSTLPKLSTGDLMFGSSKLDASSVERILTSIPTYTSGSHPLSLGIQSAAASKFAEITGTTPTTTEQTVSYKGWTIKVKINS